MNRTTVALLAALEAVIVAAIGLAICLVPLTLLWAFQYHLAADWFAFWRAGADIWLVGHGANLTVTLDAHTAAALGLTVAIAPFQVTIAALGFAVLTAGMGVRTGSRAGETPFPVLGATVAVLTFLVLSALVTVTAGSPPVRPSVWQGILLPPSVYALGILCGRGLAALRGRSPGASEDTRGAAAVSSSAHESVSGSSGTRGDASTTAVAVSLRTWTDRIPVAVRDAGTAALRAGSASAAMVVGVAAVVLAALVFGNYGAIIGLYEQLQSGALGGAALTVAQLAFLPNVVIWLASWMIGPGFAIGTGSSVSPLGTALGPIPAVPLFGVIPAGGYAVGLVAVLVPLVCGFVAATVVRSGTAALRDRPGVVSLLLTALAIGVAAGTELGLLAWWSAGAIGPGRLHDVGPNPWLVGSLATAEVGLGAAIALLTAGWLRGITVVPRIPGRR